MSLTGKCPPYPRRHFQAIWQFSRHNLLFALICCVCLCVCVCVCLTTMLPLGFLSQATSTHSGNTKTTVCSIYPTSVFSYGGSQARGLIAAAAASLHHSHSNAGSEVHLRPILQLTAMPDPLTHWARSGIKPASSGILQLLSHNRNSLYIHNLNSITSHSIALWRDLQKADLPWHLVCNLGILSYRKYSLNHVYACVLSFSF